MTTSFARSFAPTHTATFTNKKAAHLKMDGLFICKNGRARRTTLRPTQVLDIFVANFAPVGKRIDRLHALVTKKQFSLHEIERRTGHTRPFLRKQLRKFGIKNPNSRATYAPFGWDHKEKTLVPNTKEQKVLFEILSLNRSGLGCKSIAKKLNQMNIPAKAGGRWVPSSVQNILNRHKKTKEGM